MINIFLIISIGSGRKKQAQTMLPMRTISLENKI